MEFGCVCVCALCPRIPSGVLRSSAYTVSVKDRAGMEINGFSHSHGLTLSVRNYFMHNKILSRIVVVIEKFAIEYCSERGRFYSRTIRAGVDRVRRESTEPMLIDLDGNFVICKRACETNSSYIQKRTHAHTLPVPRGRYIWCREKFSTFSPLFVSRTSASLPCTINDPI